MDEDEAYSDRRLQLLERFRQSLSKPLSERFFDEDDLIEVFDFAGDINDDYLRMEALLCGARFYPDSEALYERRAIFYSQYSTDAVSKFLEDNHSTPEGKDVPFGGMIVELIDLRNHATNESVRQGLSEIVAKYDNFTDEEVIQLIDVAAAFAAIDWISDNMPLLRQKAEYINVLLYEAAVAAENTRNTDFGIPLLEELTEIEPYNSYYWLMLAKQYSLAEDYDKALSAIDYSLAINPDEGQASLVKARILYATDKDTAQVVDLLKLADKNEHTGSTEALRMLANIYSNDGRPDLAQMLLQNALDKATPEQVLEIIPELILLGPDNTEQLLDQFYRVNEDNTQLMWATWAQQLAFFGYPKLAREVIKSYQRNSGNQVISLFTIEDSFVNKKFQDVINEILEYIKDLGSNESDLPAVAAMHLISMVKSGALVDAYNFCLFFESNIDISKYKTIGNRLEFIGLLRIVRTIKRRIEEGGDAADFTDFDPLACWE